MEESLKKAVGWAPGDQDARDLTAYYALLIGHEPFVTALTRLFTHLDALLASSTHAEELLLCSPVVLGERQLATLRERFQDPTLPAELAAQYAEQVQRIELAQQSQAALSAFAADWHLPVTEGPSALARSYLARCAGRSALAVGSRVTPLPPGRTTTLALTLSVQCAYDPLNDSHEQLKQRIEEACATVARQAREALIQQAAEAERQLAQAGFVPPGVRARAAAHSESVARRMFQFNILGMSWDKIADSENDETADATRPPDADSIRKATGAAMRRLHISPRPAFPRTLATLENRPG